MNSQPMISYQFEDVNSTIVPDLTGNGFAGVIRNDAYGGASIRNESIFGKEQKTLYLTGGPRGGYLQLPEGSAGGDLGITVSCFVCIRETAEPGAVFSFGTDACLSLLTYPDEEDPEAVLLHPSFTTAGRSQEASCYGTRIAVRKGQWFHLALSLSAEVPGRAAITIDGRIAATFQHRRAAAGALSGAGLCCFGYGVHADEPLAASFGPIQVYRLALPDDELTALFSVSAQARFELEYRLLQEHGLLPDLLAQELEMPLSGQYGCAFQWQITEDACAALIRDGNFLVPLRPAYGRPDAAISLRLIMSYAGENASYDFRLTVPARPSDEALALSDLEKLEFTWPQHVLENLVLPAGGENGSAITWESRDPYIIEDNGIIHPGSAPRATVLTATARLGLACARKAFSFRLLPAVRPHVKEQSGPCGIRPQGKEGCSIKPEGNEGCSIKPEGKEGCGEIPEKQGGEAFPISPRPRALLRAPYVPEVCGTASRQEKAFSSGSPSGKTVLDDPGILSGNAGRCEAYLLLLDPDRMLFNFRKAYGADTRGAKPLGGWEEPAGLLRGHSTGHFLSALAQAFRASGNIRLKKKAAYLVSELRKLQLLCHGDPAGFVTSCTPGQAAQTAWSRDPATWGEGYLSAYSPDQFALLEQYTPYATIWAPYYTLHKLLAGLIDVWCFCGIPEALETACSAADWVCRRLFAVTTAEQRAKMWSMYIAGEYGGINESLALLAAITGKNDYLKAAHLFDNPGVFDGLAKGLDTISGIHANQHIPQMIGALACFDAGSDERYYTIARNFWKLAVNHYAYSIGGVGRGEIFREPDVLAGNIESDRNCETCAAYNLLKLTAGLFRHEPEEAAYMDYYERTLLNQIAASQTPEVTPSRHNGVTYMLPIGPGAVREYSSDYNDFTCCHGTGMENHVKYAENIYFRTGNTIYVNLYIGSNYYNTAQDPVSLQPSGSLSGRKQGAEAAPESGNSSGKAPMNPKIPAQIRPLASASAGSSVSGELLLSMDSCLPSELAHIAFHAAFGGRLMLRIPNWCDASFSLESEIPGERVCICRKGRYMELSGDFLPGDRIRVHLPFTLHLCTTPDKKDGLEAASILYGPLVMAAMHPSTEWITLNLPENLSDAFDISNEDGHPVLYYEDLKLIPMYLAHGIPYHTYFRIRRS